MVHNLQVEIRVQTLLLSRCYLAQSLGSQTDKLTCDAKLLFLLFLFLFFKTNTIIHCEKNRCAYDMLTV